MEFYNTVTLSKKNFEMIIDLLEEACENSNNYEDIGEYVSLIKTIEEEIEKDTIKATESIEEYKDIKEEIETNEEPAAELELNNVIKFLLTI